MSSQLLFPHDPTVLAVANCVLPYCSDSAYAFGEEVEQVRRA
jgi:hypothetical protein